MRNMRKGIFPKLAVFVMAAAVVFAVIGGISSYASADMYDKEYTIRNVLSDYQFVVDGDASLTSHIVGAMVVGGEAKVGSFGDGAIANSYFKKLSSYGNYSRSQYLKHEKGYEGYTNVIAYYKNADSAGAELARYDGDGDYFDFDEAFKNFRAESLAWAEDSDAKELSMNDITKKVNVDGQTGKLLTIPLDDSKKIVIPADVWNEADFIMLDGPQTVADFAEDEYIISILSKKVVLGSDYGYVAAGDAKKALFLKTKAGTNNAKEFRAESGSVYALLLDQSNGLMNSKLKGLIQGGQMCLTGMKLFWNMPNATEVRTAYLPGHVVAPKAEASAECGNFEGSYLVKTMQTSGEAHFYPYRKVAKYSERETALPKTTVTPKPTVEPTAKTTAKPTALPKTTVTPKPTATAKPTAKPTALPKTTVTPESTATAKPTAKPTATVKPTALPKTTVTPKPTVTAKPTAATEVPSATAPSATETSAEGNVTPTGTPVPTEQQGSLTAAEPTETPDTENGEALAVPTPDTQEGQSLAVPVPTDQTVMASEEGVEPTDGEETTTIEDEDTPTTSMEDEETPLGRAKPKSKQTTILDEDVPLSDAAPDTGDSTNLWFPVAGMGVSAIGIIVVLAYQRKRRGE